MWGICMKRMMKGLSSLMFPFVWSYSIIVSYRLTQARVPPITNPLLLKNAKTLAELIRTKKVSSYEVVSAYIDRIKIIEPIINSVVQDRFKDAQLEAKKVDEMLASNGDAAYWEKTKPLLGVPISVKEAIAVKGMSHNAGRVVPKVRIAEDDADVVKNLKEAGAIVIAVTNTPELCLFWESYNNATGFTNNPYNTLRTAGGSSGGECSLISAGGSVIGLGSDMVGSGRLPAMFCGMYGHKPTSGLISLKGHLPTPTDPEFNNFMVMSPMTRYATDLALLLRLMSPKETACLNLEEEVDLKKLKIFYMDNFSSPMIKSVSRSIREAIEKSAMHFKEHGIEPQKVSIENFDGSFEATMTLMYNLKSTNNVFQKSEDCEDWNMCDVVKEMVKKSIGCSKFTTYAINHAFIKKFYEYLPKHGNEEMKTLKMQLTKRFQELLGDDGVLILPIFPTTAHKHFQMYYKMLDIVYISAFNVLEMPATACPLGLDKSGLPVGVQLVANKFQDRLTLAVACELEKAFGGWVPVSESKQNLRSQDQSIA